VYADYYGFREKPFSLTPDPRYLFLSSGHQEALAHLEYGRREHGGFIVLTGEVGTGKTTVARHFLATLGAGTATAIVLYPVLSAAELVQGVLRDLKVPSPDGASLKGLVDRLHDFLLSARAQGHDVVLLIDEAQDLSAEVLEQVRLISNLETDTTKLIQIILVGQPELRAMLARPELRQLAQRVTARYHLGGLNRTECEAYVRHRLGIAGGEGKVVFAAGAPTLVHRATGGIPRLVNLLCDRAILAAYVDGARVISISHVRRATAEILDQPARPAAPRVLLWAGLSVLALAIAVAGYGWTRRAPAVASSSAGRTAQVPAASGPEGPSGPAMESLLLSLDDEASYTHALQAIGALWARRPLLVTQFITHTAQVRRLDMPVILEMAHPARRNTGFIALVALAGEEAVVDAGLGRELRVPLGEIERHWTRRALFPWPARAALAGAAVPALRTQSAQAALLKLGYDVSDASAAVTRFQRETELVPDGAVGPRTLLALYALSDRDRPRLARGAP
jgi:general secretion pathway protein A